MMKKIRLGKTGLWVSRIGIGGIPLTRPSEEDAIRVVHRALELGINFIDTAWGYQPSEERIGKSLASSNVPREAIVLCTRTHVNDRETAETHLAECLDYLHTDYLDIWQLHNVSTRETYHAMMGVGGAFEAAQDVRNAGKVHHLGISGHNVDIMLEAVKTGLFEVIQFPLNFISNEALDELLPYTSQHGIGFIAMKPFAGGRVRNANLAIKYLLQFDHVVPDPGVETVAELEEIVDIVNGNNWDLSETERPEIQAIREELGTRFCRQCQYCMPCPQGVNIWMLMILKVMYTLWPLENFLDMEDVVNSGRQRTQCGACEPKCPYKLPIREMIQEHIAFFESVSTQA
jgi:predicted aldo/keto reductase-like oxidoreductase